MSDFSHKQEYSYHFITADVDNVVEQIVKRSKRIRKDAMNWKRVYEDEYKRYCEGPPSENEKTRRKKAALPKEIEDCVTGDSIQHMFAVIRPGMVSVYPEPGHSDIGINAFWFEYKFEYTGTIVEIHKHTINGVDMLDMDVYADNEFWGKINRNKIRYNTGLTHSNMMHTLARTMTKMKELAESLEKTEGWNVEMIQTTADVLDERNKDIPEYSYKFSYDPMQFAHAFGVQDCDNECLESYDPANIDGSVRAMEKIIGIPLLFPMEFDTFTLVKEGYNLKIYKCQSTVK